MAIDAAQRAPGPGGDAGTPADDTELAARLGLAAARLTRHLRRRLSGNLSLSQLSALHLIERAGPLAIGELAEAEGAAAATMTRIVDALERDGYVRRRGSTTDRRSVMLSVTAKGRRLVQRRRRSRTAYVATRLARLTPAERRALAAALPALERLSREEP